MVSEPLARSSNRDPQEPNVYVNNETPFSQRNPGGKNLGKIIFTVVEVLLLLSLVIGLPLYFFNQSKVNSFLISRFSLPGVSNPKSTSLSQETTINTSEGLIKEGKLSPPRKILEVGLSYNKKVSPTLKITSAEIKDGYVPTSTAGEYSLQLLDGNNQVKANIPFYIPNKMSVPAKTQVPGDTLAMENVTLDAADFVIALPYYDGGVLVQLTTLAGAKITTMNINQQASQKDSIPVIKMQVIELVGSNKQSLLDLFIPEVHAAAVAKIALIGANISNGTFQSRAQEFIDAFKNYGFTDKSLGVLPARSFGEGYQIWKSDDAYDFGCKTENGNTRCTESVISSVINKVPDIANQDVVVFVTPSCSNGGAFLDKMPRPTVLICQNTDKFFLKNALSGKIDRQKYEILFPTAQPLPERISPRISPSPASRQREDIILPSNPNLQPMPGTSNQNPPSANRPSQTNRPPSISEDNKEVTVCENRVEKRSMVKKLGELRAELKAANITVPPPNNMITVTETYERIVCPTVAPRRPLVLPGESNIAPKPKGTPAPAPSSLRPSSTPQSTPTVSNTPIPQATQEGRQILSVSINGLPVSVNNPELDINLPESIMQGGSHDMAISITYRENGQIKTKDLHIIINYKSRQPENTPVGGSQQITPAQAPQQPNQIPLPETPQPSSQPQCNWHDAGYREIHNGEDCNVLTDGCNNWNWNDCKSNQQCNWHDAGYRENHNGQDCQVWTDGCNNWDFKDCNSPQPQCNWHDAGYREIHNGEDCNVLTDGCNNWNWNDCKSSQSQQNNSGNTCEPHSDDNGDGTYTEWFSDCHAEVKSF